MNNVVRTILSGVSNLFTVPSGGSEQTISSTTPNVYAMMYLKQTKQVTGDIETVGNANIRNGKNFTLYFRIYYLNLKTTNKNKNLIWRPENSFKILFRSVISVLTKMISHSISILKTSHYIYCIVMKIWKTRKKVKLILYYDVIYLWFLLVHIISAFRI